ncbi:uncharacterized protein LOC124413935 isoform X2 [Diprion similis]|uniref:uncharacterized protein LOC124413935 isoform X2 n=1 Tax=Diprion similis TaxID=362088 RepID=UPI001EF82EAB|nr:uncharacterized protein LOC124413935 isoform X2 [Diprion similis]
MNSRTAACNILDLPDEILLKIILSLNLRERLPLAYSCRRLNNLVFDDEKALRNLDFSTEGYLTRISDVKPYFLNKKKCERIQSLNVAGIYCPKPKEMLKSICKAKNLIELDMTSVPFENFKQFANLLQPLERLKKLSIIWPTANKNDSKSQGILEESLRKLTHLSVTLRNLDDKWHLIKSFNAMIDLEELRLVQTYFVSESGRGCVWLPTPKVLLKFRLVACLGNDLDLLEQVILEMMPNREQWIKLSHVHFGKTRHFHYENDIKICKYLSKDIVRTSYAPERMGLKGKVGKVINFESILKELMISKSINLDKDYRMSSDYCPYAFLPRIQDVKLLLGNPSQPIYYMNLNHNIEQTGHLPLVLSMFPSLTELVLSNIIISNPIKRKYKDSEDKGVEPETSCFQKVVENSPNVKALTISAGILRGSGTWDLAALRIIAGWRNLTSLFLVKIPIKDGQFLVEIGSQCKNLEKLRLVSLGPQSNCCYAKELMQMLIFCHNLKDFSIEQSNLCQIPRIFDTLAKNLKLRRVCLKSLGKSRNLPNLIPSIEGLIRSCKLLLFVCEYKGLADHACDELKSTLQSLKVELSRPSFQFDVIKCSGSGKDHVRNFDLHYTHKDLLLPFSYVDSLYRLNG